MQLKLNLQRLTSALKYEYKGFKKLFGNKDKLLDFDIS